MSDIITPEEARAMAEAVTAGGQVDAMAEAIPAPSQPPAGDDQLPPLPVLTDKQWHALPREERVRLRQLKLAHRRANALRPQEPPAPPDGHEPGGSSSPTRKQADETAFRDVHGRPLYLTDTYFGASCFLVLSGPSVHDHDLSQLRRRGIYTIAVNNAGTVIRPNAWHFVDPPEKFHSAIWLDPGVTKFVHHRFLDYSLREKVENPDGPDSAPAFRPLKLANGRTAHVRDMPGVVSVVRSAEFRPHRWLDEPSINWGNSKRSSRRNHFPRDLNVFLATLKLAYALGFRAVYLLGCDFQMREERPYAFAEDKHVSAVGSNNRKYETISAMLRLLKPHFDTAGYRVFNCNPKSGLTIFPHVPYSESIKAASGHVPQDPLDTLNWYRK